MGESGGERMDLNHRPMAYEAIALTRLSYSAVFGLLRALAFIDAHGLNP